MKKKKGTFLVYANAFYVKTFLKYCIFHLDEKEGQPFFCSTDGTLLVYWWFSHGSFWVVLTTSWKWLASCQPSGRDIGWEYLFWVHYAFLFMSQLWPISDHPSHPFLDWFRVSVLIVNHMPGKCNACQYWRTSEGGGWEEREMFVV